MTRKNRTLIVAALLVLTLSVVMVAGTGRGQNPEQNTTSEKTPEKTGKQGSPTLKIDVDLVLVNATVTDRLGRYVSGLEAQHFQITEDRTEQKVEYFSAEDVPISVGVIFDVSGSMKDKIATARNA